MRAWQAVHVARSCHHLSREAAGLVDLAVSGHLGQLPWARFGRVLQAGVLQADPATAAERAEQTRRSRGVWAYPGEDGLKTLVAKAAAGDVVCLLATVNRLADVLAAEGDSDPVDERRAKALGLLAQPARALQLLIAHQHDPDQHNPSAPGEDEEQEERDTGRGGLDLTGRHDLHLGKDLQPRVVLHFHLSSAAVALGHGVVRPEHGEPTSLEQLRSWLAETGCPVTVRPVLDPAATAAVDAYETPLRMREALFARNPAEVFPFGAAVRRTLDLDHSVPYVRPERGGPPGQRGLHNLGPLSRSHRRAVTFGRWRRRQPEPGTYVFRSPHGHVFVVTNQGTLTLGTGAFAADVCNVLARILPRSRPQPDGRLRTYAPQPTPDAPRPGRSRAWWRGPPGRGGGSGRDQRWLVTALRALASVASAETGLLVPRATRMDVPSCCSTVSVTPAFATRTPASGVAARK